MTAAATWTSAVWETPEFREELRDFVVSAVGASATLETVKIRPWSAVWRVVAGGETFYAKQNCPGQAFEARLVSALSAMAPEYVVPVVAADAERDLLLTADLGRTLAELGGDHDVDMWCRIARDAALLQRAVVPGADGLGLTEMLPECATTYAGDAIGRLGALPAGDPRRLDQIVAERLRSAAPDDRALVGPGGRPRPAAHPQPQRPARGQRGGRERSRGAPALLRLR